MSRRFYENIDLQKNELQNARLHQLGSDPGSPVEGQIIWRTDTHLARLYNGTSWVDVAIGGASVPLATVTTKGDLIVATGNAAVSRLGAGANDTLLVAASGQATGLQWRVLANADLAEKIATADLTDWPRSAALDLNNQKITSLLDPTAAQDAATKAYTDAQTQNKDWKDSVRLATIAALPAYTRTGNVITASANGAIANIDGTAPALNDRILLKNGASGTDNGPYSITQLGTGGTPFILTRTTDADTSAKVTNGLTTFVEEGSLGGSEWTLTTANPITLNTTALTFTQTGGAGSYTATSPITLTGNAFGFSTTYGGNTSLVTLGTVTTGTWSGTAIAVAKGGTGATDAATARSNLSAAGKFSGALTGGSTSEVVTHNLNTRDVVVSVVNNATPWDSVDVTWEATSVNTITIRSDGLNLPASYRVTVIG